MAKVASVFISYAHENAEHVRRVAEVAEILRTHGLEVFLDRWREDQRNDWNQLTTAEIENADYIVAVASSAFHAAANGTAPEGSSRGVEHELSIIRDLLHDNRKRWFHRIIPLVLPPWTTGDIPRFLQPATATNVIVDEVTDEALAPLIALLAEPADDGTPRAAQRDRPRLRLPALTTRNTMIAGSAAVALVTIATIGISLLRDSDIQSEGSVGVGEGNSVVQNSGTCAQVSDNSTCIVQLQRDVAEIARDSSSDAEFKKNLAQREQATAAPTGNGPWPFVVVDTLRDGVDLGLYARTNDQVDGSRLGVAPSHAIVWADCESANGFEPPGIPPENNAGPHWLRVRWTPVSPLAISVSEPDEPQRAWMYRGFTVPLDHNGHVPSC